MPPGLSGQLQPDDLIRMLTVGAQTPVAMSPEDYAATQAAQADLMNQYNTRPTGPSLGQGVATALIGALPAALGALVGGETGLGYGLKGGGEAAEANLKQLAVNRDQAAQSILSQLAQNQQNLSQADIFNANNQQRQDRLADEKNMANYVAGLHGPNGPYTTGQLAVEAGKPGNRELSETERVEFGARLGLKPGTEPKTMAEAKLIMDSMNLDTRIKGEDRRADLQSAQFTLAPGSKFVDEKNPPSPKLVEDYNKRMASGAALTAGLTQLQAELAKPWSGETAGNIREMMSQINRANKEAAGTGANTTFIEIQQFLDGLTPGVFNNGMTSYYKYARDKLQGIDPAKAISHSIGTINNGLAAKAFEENIYTPQVASFIEKARREGMEPTPAEVRQMIQERLIK